ncbi:EAL domain-containing protein [Aeromonas simiae]|uniref:EAL domain-containing protein n=1 Tax=Aeromonas simiae TaxID=218936 RepID=UPI00266D6E51|nr:EAL domain-containing protein [Aeromonas simiae]
MHSSQFKSRSLTQRLAIALAAGGLLLLLCLCLILWLGWQGLHSQTQERLQQAVQKLDLVFDHAQQVAIEVEPLIGNACGSQESLLRKIVASTPDVRSVTIEADGALLCSSVYGHREKLVNIQPYAEGQLLLQSNNLLTPDQSVLIYRRHVGNYSVLVGINGHDLSYVLGLLGEIRLQVGGLTLDAQERVRKAGSRVEGQRLSIASTRYAYRVNDVINATIFRTYMLEHALLEGILALALSVFFGVVCFRRTKSGLHHELCRALDAGEFVAYLQPMMNREGTHVTGGEVLMRWMHPELGLIRPDRFIPLAEDSGLIVPMTRELMRQVREGMGPRAAALPPHFHFSFNIAASHCCDLSLVEDCRDFLAAFSANPVNLVLELTERELVVPNETTMKLFDELERMGVSIAIDDFGTGHSSLVYLQQFKVDFLKIDQSFVARIGSDALSRHIVDNVVDLASRLDLSLVAEGVETQEQADYLMARGVDFLQGYLYGNPVPLADFWLEAKLP